MARNTPETIPAEFAAEHIADAYRRGWNHGHGIACHNVPRIGQKLFTDGMGRVTVDAENIREVHADITSEAADNSRCYSPFEFTAHEFNSAQPDELEIECIPDDAGKPVFVVCDADEETHEFETEELAQTWIDAQPDSEQLWAAFEAGTSDAIAADLAEYTDELYGIEPEEDSRFETVTGTAPSHWAVYFINDDSSGMEDDDIEQADKFAEWLGGNIVSCEDEGFMHTHDAMRVCGTLAADCCTYTALIEK